MKILDLNTLYIDGGEGGVNTYLREKARCLSEVRGVRHVIVVPGRAAARRRLGASALYTVKSPRLPGNGQHRVLADVRTVSRLLREEQPDVVEVDTSYVLGHVAARALERRRVPIVGFHHVHLPFLYTRAVRSWLRRRICAGTEPLVWRYTRFCSRPCDRVVVTTRDMYARLEERSFPRLELVPLGVNLDVFRPHGGGPRPAVPGVDPRRPVVLYVGRLSREKDLEVLFTAHRDCLGPAGAQLVIAGDGPLHRKVRRFACATAGVAYLGMRAYGDDLARLYRSADVLAVPGRYETFSLIVLEALASGLPVVAARQGGPAEILPGIGELAEPGDALDFGRKVLAVLREPLASSVYRDHVERLYSWEKTFDGLLELYRTLAGEKGGRRPVAALAEEDRLLLPSAARSA